jgi:hypothetical protein
MLNKFKAWYAKPYSSDQSVTGWALFVLLLIALSIFWKMILSHIVHSAVD